MVRSRLDIKKLKFQNKFKTIFFVETLIIDLHVFDINPEFIIRGTIFCVNRHYIATQFVSINSGIKVTCTDAITTDICVWKPRHSGVFCAMRIPLHVLGVGGGGVRKRKHYENICDVFVPDTTSTIHEFVSSFCLYVFVLCVLKERTKKKNSVCRM